MVNEETVGKIAARLLIVLLSKDIEAVSQIVEKVAMTITIILVDLVVNGRLYG